MENYQYDAFISFAVEDKIEIANELCANLQARGLKIWYSGYQLMLGKSIEQTIKEGLDKSRFGIVIVTKSYFQTNWAQKELGALLAKEKANELVLIPVLHGITPEEVGQFDPALAERWSLLTRSGIDNVCSKIVNHISQNHHTQGKKKILKIRYLLVLFLILLLAVATSLFYLKSQQNKVPTAIVNKVVDRRISDFQKAINDQLFLELNNANSSPVTKETVIEHMNQWSTLDSHFRNFYEFSNGFQTFHFEKNVSPVTGINFESWTAQNNYDFKYPQIYLVSEESGSNPLNKTFIYFNTQNTTYQIDHMVSTDSLTIVTVSYQEPIRIASFQYEYGVKTSMRKHKTVSLKGHKLTEDFYFSRVAEKWEVVKID